MMTCRQVAVTYKACGEFLSRVTRSDVAPWAIIWSRRLSPSSTSSFLYIVHNRRRLGVLGIDFQLVSAPQATATALRFTVADTQLYRSLWSAGAWQRIRGAVGSSQIQW